MRIICHSDAVKKLHYHHRAVNIAEMQKYTFLQGSSIGFEDLLVFHDVKGTKAVHIMLNSEFVAMVCSGVVRAA